MYEARTFSAKQFSKKIQEKNEYVNLTEIWIRA
jgi:hypothetical protein